MADAGARRSTWRSRCRWAVCRHRRWRHRRWRHIGIILATAIACSLSFAQFFMSVLVFTYINIPQCVLVGQNLALLASVLSIGDAGIYYYLGRRFRCQAGIRDPSCFRQRIFYFTLTLRTTIWWLTCLNGAFIYGFNRNHIGCPPAPISAILGRIMSACQMYQVSLSLSVPGFIVSAFELVLFFRCKRPFLSYRAIFRGDESPADPENNIGLQPQTTTHDRAKPAPLSNPAGSPPAAVPHNELDYPAGTLQRAWRSLSCDFETCPCYSSITRHASSDQSSACVAHVHLPNGTAQSLSATTVRNLIWAPYGTNSPKPMTRRDSCTSTLIDPLSRRTSLLNDVPENKRLASPHLNSSDSNSTSPERRNSDSIARCDIVPHNRAAVRPGSHCRDNRASSSLNMKYDPAVQDQNHISQAFDERIHELLPPFSPSSFYPAHPPRAYVRHSLPSHFVSTENSGNHRVVPGWPDEEWAGGNGGEGT